MSRIPAVTLVVALSTALAPRSLPAASIVEERSLSLGNLVVVNNSSPGTLTVPRAGSTVTSPQVISVTSGTPGRYRLSGLTAYADVTLDFSSTPLLTLGTATAWFSVTTFDPSPTIRTDATGAASFDLGVTVETSGNGASYPDGDYSGTITITVISP